MAFEKMAKGLLNWQGKYNDDFEDVHAQLGNKAEGAHDHNGMYVTPEQLTNGLEGVDISNHTHDDRYFTQGQVNTQLSGKANTSHNHNASNINAGTLPVARGGTGAATAAAALTALGAAAANHNHSNATTAAAGFLSTADKLKIDNCPTNTNTALAGKAKTGAFPMVNLPLQSGISIHRSCYYYKNENNEVNVHVAITRTTGNFGYSEHIATLPAGYRPARQVEYLVIITDGGQTAGTGTIVVNTNGQLVIFPHAYSGKVAHADMLFIC